MNQPSSTIAPAEFISGVGPENGDLVLSASFKPLWRSLTFWGGLFGVVFSFWLWADSLLYSTTVTLTHGCDRALEIKSKSGVLVLHLEKNYSPPTGLSPFWLKGRSRADLTLPLSEGIFPLPHYVSLNHPGMPWGPGYLMDLQIPAWLFCILASAMWGVGLARRRKVRRII